MLSLSLLSYAGGFAEPILWDVFAKTKELSTMGYIVKIYSYYITGTSFTNQLCLSKLRNRPSCARPLTVHEADWSRSFNKEASNGTLAGWIACAVFFKRKGCSFTIDLSFLYFQTYVGCSCSEDGSPLTSGLCTPDGCDAYIPHIALFAVFSFAAGVSRLAGLSSQLRFCCKNMCSWLRYNKLFEFPRNTQSLQRWHFCIA